MRHMNHQEKVQFHHLFPHLNVDSALVTGDATPVYNCISWTLGITNHWLWPGNTAAEFHHFYAYFGYQNQPHGDIAAWALTRHDGSWEMTHGSVSRVEEEMRWESKCGALLRVLHDYDELRGNNYGDIVLTYKKTGRQVQTTEGLNMHYTDEQLKKIAQLVAKVSKEDRERYSVAFEKWKSTWFSGDMAVQSNPMLRKGTDGFDELKRMGEPIIPLIIDSMTDQKNFMALQLYEDVQTDEQLKVKRTVENIVAAGEQGLAYKSVILYLDHTR